MSKPRIRIVVLSCPRCGREVHGLNRPIHGSRAMYRALSGVCENCTTDQEKAAIIEDIAAGIFKAAR